ncbi:nucleoside phosphorylase [Arenibacter sp. GZD96]|uniref:nucleoside phosphorylase n=1 Tax=Aurantibrevibacter litoralis TaxID=3106030 RepID=UPI002AFF6800|nr:nucleoside phosphorylase [Arenibacter sp. GZD-96]MEA1785407.1 nucleoside phosphorylase [Arenibacter sp. GZD-96]
MHLGASELVLNPDNSIYHLNLHSSELAPLVITVGDPDRVAMVSRYFDTVEVRKHKREFITHTGILNKKRITVISTGIGTDNIDIVLNELDALVNIDFSTRSTFKRHTALDIIRIGTSGAIQQDIPVDSFLMSEYAVGLDSLLHYYKSESVRYPEIEDAFVSQMHWPVSKSKPYVTYFDADLATQLQSDKIKLGCTATNVGFYGPQGRRLRLETSDADLNKKMTAFTYNGMRITNMEMETSGIYGLSKLLGHRAVSLNCILANRNTGQFSKNPEKAIDRLIMYALERLTAH